MLKAEEWYETGRRDAISEMAKNGERPKCQRCQQTTLSKIGSWTGARWSDFKAAADIIIVFVVILLVALRVFS